MLTTIHWHRVKWIHYKHSVYNSNIYHITTTKSRYRNHTFRQAKWIASPTQQEQTRVNNTNTKNMVHRRNCYTVKDTSLNECLACSLNALSASVFALEAKPPHGILCNLKHCYDTACSNLPLNILLIYIFAKTFHPFYFV